jgi:excisionase family DNA binding protein
METPERTDEAVDLLDRELLTVDQVATYLQVHRETVRKWLRSGELVGVNLGGVAGWRIRREEVERFIQSRFDKQ